MINDEPGTGARGERFGLGESPLTLAQLQATGAEVVGSDGEKIGDLKEVGDVDFLVERTLKRDIRVPVSRVREITADSNKIVLDVPAEQAKDLSRYEPLGEADPAADFSHSTEHEKGAWEIKKESG